MSRQMPENSTAQGQAPSLANNPENSYYALIYGLSMILLFGTGLLKAILFVQVDYRKLRIYREILR